MFETLLIELRGIFSSSPANHQMIVISEKQQIFQNGILVKIKQNENNQNFNNCNCSRLKRAAQSIKKYNRIHHCFDIVLTVESFISTL